MRAVILTLFTCLLCLVGSRACAETVTKFVGQIISANLEEVSTEEGVAKGYVVVLSQLPTAEIPHPVPRGAYAVFLCTTDCPYPATFSGTIGRPGLRAMFANIIESSGRFLPKTGDVLDLILRKNDLVKTKGGLAAYASIGYRDLSYAAYSADAYAYLVNKNNGNLFAVIERKLPPHLKYVEIEALSRDSAYQKSLVDSEPSGLSKAPEDYAFALRGDDLCGIRVRNTQSGYAELTCVTANSHYLYSSPPIPIPLPLKDAPSFVFSFSRRGDLIAVKRTNTGSKRLEVHVLSGAGGKYNTFSLRTATPIADSDIPNFVFDVGNNGDLYCIKTAHTQSGRVEMHILSAASLYHQFTLHTETPLPSSTASLFSFGVDASGDLLAIMKARTSTKRVEVHRLSKASAYRTFALNTATPWTLSELIRSLP